MNIYLIGYMGSGKTTVGKKLATQLNRPFYDLDQLIEKQEKKSITAIFSENGESYFREIERQELHKTFLLTPSVIALGGGTPCFFDNMKEINARGCSVYLEMNAAALVNRLRHEKQQRPLIKGKSEAELLQYIQSSLEQRMPFYKQAKLIVSGINMEIQSLATQIENFVSL